MAAEQASLCACSRQRPNWMSPDMFANMSRLFFLGSLYIVVSACMVAFNKFLIHEDRFPFAVPLVLIHAGFCSTCTLVMFLVKPSLFPSLTNPEGKVAIDRDLILRGALPIAVLFSLQLMLANTAYLHSSMAFLQMMKEANLVLVYMFSLFVAMEVFCFDKLKVIVFILAATMLTIHSEIKFSWTGFGLQASSQLFECLKIVLQALLLSSAGRKLDVLSYVLIVMPLCFCILGSILLTLIYIHPSELVKTPSWADIVTWWPWLAANACLAFGLNVAIAMFMKESAAVGFILAGIVKDAVIVLAGVLALHESIAPLQMLGFVTQLILIWIWSAMKIFPDKFAGGLWSGLVLLAFPVNENRSLLIAEPLEDFKSYGSHLKQEENSSKC